MAYIIQYQKYQWVNRIKQNFINRIIQQNRSKKSQKSKSEQNYIINYPFYKIIPDSQQADTKIQIEKIIWFWQPFVFWYNKNKVNQILKYIFIVCGMIIPVLLLVLDLFVFQKNSCSFKKLEFDCYLNAIDKNTEGIINYFSIKEISISFCLMVLLTLLMITYQYFDKLFHLIQQKISKVNIDEFNFLTLQIYGMPFKQIFQSQWSKNYNLYEMVVLIIQKIIEDAIQQKKKQYNQKYYQEKDKLNQKYYNRQDDNEQTKQNNQIQKAKYANYCKFATIKNILLPLNSIQISLSKKMEDNKYRQQIFNMDFPVFITFTEKNEFNTVYQILSNRQNRCVNSFFDKLKKEIDNKSKIGLSISKSSAVDKIDYEKYYGKKSINLGLIFWPLYILIILLIFLIACLKKNIKSWQVGLLLKIIDLILNLMITKYFVDSFNYTKQKNLGTKDLFSLITSILTQIFAPMFICKINRAEFQLKLSSIVIAFALSNAILPTITLIGQYLLELFKQKFKKQPKFKKWLDSNKLYQKQFLLSRFEQGIYFYVFKTTLFTLFFIRISVLTLLLSAFFGIAFMLSIQHLFILKLQNQYIKINRCKVESSSEKTKSLLPNQNDQNQNDPDQKKQYKQYFQFSNNKKFLKYYKFAFFAYVIGTFILFIFYKIQKIDLIPPLIFIVLFVIIECLSGKFNCIKHIEDEIDKNINQTFTGQTLREQSDKILEQKRKKQINAEQKQNLIRLRHELLDQRSIESIAKLQQSIQISNKVDKQQIIQNKFKGIIPQQKIEELTYKFKNNLLTLDDRQYIVNTYTKWCIINLLEKDTAKNDIIYGLNLMSLLQIEPNNLPQKKQKN